MGRILVVLIAIAVVALLGDAGQGDKTVVSGAAAPAASGWSGSAEPSGSSRSSGSFGSSQTRGPGGPASAAPAPRMTGQPPPAGTAPRSTPVPTRPPEPSAPSAARAGTPASAGGQQAMALLAVLSVADGDTLTVGTAGGAERVRIIGIDTPEVGECGAGDARKALEGAVSGGVRLERDPTQADRDRYGRLLRHVVLTDGSLAAQRLIGAGHGREYTYARPYRHRGAYLSAQRSARERGRGIWAAACGRALAAPAPTRSPEPTAKATQRSAPAPRGGCNIKGNINSEAEKIFHVPGGRSYEATKITTSKGEKWFCSESEALAEGWRAARG